MQASKEPPAVRVTTQYWKGGVRICELDCLGRMLDIHMPRPEDERWTLEGHTDHGTDAIVVVGAGATRAAALDDLATAWQAKAPLLGLHAFDWKAVADVLRTVNMIE